jgi:hypothetical protein
MFETLRATALKCHDEMLVVQDRAKNTGADLQALNKQFDELTKELYHAYSRLLGLQRAHDGDHVFSDAVAVVEAYFGDLRISPPALP